MKILFLIPSIDRSLRFQLFDGIPQFLSKKFGRYPNFGVLFVASYMASKGYEIKILDLNCEELTYKALSERIRKESPSVIGISAFTFTFLEALTLAKYIKRNFSIPVVIGGLAVTLHPFAVMHHDCFDFGIIGEGEITFHELIKCLEKKFFQGLSKIEGLVYREKDKIITNQQRAPVKDRNQLPKTKWELLDISKYYSHNLPVPYMGYLSSIGCPFRCIFCCKEPWGQNVRKYSAEWVVEDLTTLVEKFGIKGIDIFDDIFCFDKERLHKILTAMIQRKLNLKFSMLNKIGLLSEKEYALLAEAGCKTIAFGVESGSPRILKILDKKADIEKATFDFKMTRKYKISGNAMFMVGNPDESIDDLERTIKFMKKANPDYVKANITTPYPGSSYYSEISKNIIGKDYFEEMILKGYPDNTIKFNFSRLSDKKLAEYQRRMHLYPYLRLNSNIFKFKKAYNFKDIIRAVDTIVNFL